MGSDLHLSFAASMWVQAAYLLTTAVLLIPMGRLADQYGRVRFYLMGIAIFALGSLLAALSINGAWLIGSRIVQGAGGALMIATAAAITTAVFPPNERGRALGINVMAVYIGLSVGPPLGGLLVDTLGWRWIFLINLPIGLIVFLWGSMMLPQSERVDDAPRVDVVGATLLGLFLISLLVPLTFATEWGWAAPRRIGLLVVSAASLVGFVVVERRVKSPILDLNLLLHNRLFAAANFAALLNYMALFAISVLTAIHLQIVQGRSASATGLLILSQPLIMAALSPLQRPPERPHRFTRARHRQAWSPSLPAWCCSALMPEQAPVWQVAAYLALVGLGMASFSAPNASAIMGSVRRDQLSVASSFIGTMRTAGQALSVGAPRRHRRQPARPPGRAAAVHARRERSVRTRDEGGGRVRTGLHLRDACRRGARPARRARVAHARGSRSGDCRAVALGTAAPGDSCLRRPGPALSRPRALRRAPRRTRSRPRPVRPERVPCRAGAAGAPSMLRCGSHSSQLGRYQFQRPSSFIAAGTSIVRIEGGVQQHRDGEAEAHLLEHHEVAGREAREHGDHDQRRAGDDAGGRADALGDRQACCRRVRSQRLLDAAEQEDLVVHREAEQDGEEEQRHPLLDHRRPAGSRGSGAPALQETRA